MSLKDNINKTKEFLTHDIWFAPVGHYSKLTEFVIKQIKIIIFTIKGISQDKVQIRASALTYYSIFALVPLLTVALGIANSFGYKEHLITQLNETFSGREEILNWILDFANNYLSNTNTGIVAGVGFIALIWSVVNIFSRVEDSLNEIWEVNKSRHFARRLGDYIAILFISPILLIAFGGSTVFITTQIASFSNTFTWINYLTPFVYTLLKIAPYVLICCFLTMMYIVIPNTKVRFTSGLIAGIITGAFFSLLQWGYIEFQVGVSRLNAIYGSFAALPLFVIWLQTSWLIVLAGAELAFANQNVDMYEYESESLTVSPAVKRVVALMLIKSISLRFHEGKDPISAVDLAKEHNMPIRLIRAIIADLLNTGLLLELESKEHKTGVYIPARDINLLTISFVYNALDHIGNNNVLKNPSNQYSHFWKLNEDIINNINKSDLDGPVYLLDI